MFENGIKELYEKSKPTEHKQLALLFELLPYLNLKYNVICEDTTEEVLEHIKPYTLRQIANMLKETNITRFKKKLMDMTVNSQPVVCINEIKNKKMITINPKIYYKGTKLEDLKYLQGLFDMSLNVDEDQ
jgi:prolyl oligopeptidase PreP (S9A serine peptidase family)